MIDFYTGAPTRDKPISMHLDVRPALDSLDALQNRLVKGAREYFGGIIGGGAADSAATAPAQTSEAAGAKVAQDAR